MDPSVSERLATLGLGEALGTYAAGVSEEVKLHVLDTLGVAIAASDEAIASAAHGAALSLGGACADSTLWVSGATTSADLAAMVNGTLAHALDFDDTHAGSVTHVSSVIVPAALACGEKLHASGAQVIAAIVAGYETMIRVGRAAVGGYQASGFHTTSVCGPFGAAACAGRLLGLTEGELVNAFGVAASQASGIQEFLSDGSWPKRFHSGWAAHGGIVAAYLAKHGFTGPRTAFEGRFGLFHTHVHSGEWSADAAVEELGRRWFTDEVVPKFYASGHINHPFIDAAFVLRPAIELGDVERIVFKVGRGAVPIVCEPWDLKLRPETAYEARFSLPVCVAAAFVDGESVDYLDGSRLLRPEVLDVAARSSYEIDPDGGYPGTFDGTVEVTLKSGEVVSEYRALPSSMRSDGAGQSTIRKYATNVTKRLGAERAQALQAAVMSMDAVDDVSVTLSTLRV